MSLLLILPLIGCKKKDPEPAPEAAVEEEAPAPDPTTMVRVQMQTDAEKIKVVCKDTGTTEVFPVTDGVASLTVPGESCFFVVKPGDAQYQGVKGGTSLTCLVDDVGAVQCK
ncbi:MAG: hypothetical protein GY913_15735 [Proteobacteria bacterium]|nr:hypothetical protein [Pseudomonadota bacterium]MCP4918356.1 hypothetical protein [Pseudomonadota bacterium]